MKKGLSNGIYKINRAQVAELADAHGSGPCTGNGVRVQVSPWAQRLSAYYQLTKNK